MPRNGYLETPDMRENNTKKAVQYRYFVTDVVGSTPAQGEVYNIM
jgi:hypothetical protein